MVLSLQTVGDNGIGIKKETLTKIFDTTKSCYDSLNP